jgi:hypothetical protein
MGLSKLIILFPELIILFPELIILFPELIILFSELIILFSESIVLFFLLINSAKEGCTYLLILSRISRSKQISSYDLPRRKTDLFCVCNH